MNSSFSSNLPNLQIAWDSTSLSALKTCPRLYQYSIVQGYAPRALSVHLSFGLWFHKALEMFDHLRLQGVSHDQALAQVVHKALCNTWDFDHNRPWMSDIPEKNRFTLIRSIVWYLDQFKDDPLQTIVLANGKPAVELSFRFDIEVKSVTGEPYLFCGHLDRLATLNDEPYVIDRKTTKSTLSPSYFEKYSPDNQFSMYAFAGKIAYNIPIRGLIVDAVQVAQGFSKFQRGFVLRDEALLNEWFNDIMIYLEQAETYAERGYWPMNDKSCNQYGGCAFRGICSKSPLSRQQWLEREFVTRTWDPLQVRGDI